MTKKEPIFVDAEGINLGPKGNITLLQISTIDGQAYIFDLLQNSNLWMKGNYLQSISLYILWRIEIWLFCSICLIFIYFLKCFFTEM